MKNLDRALANHPSCLSNYSSTNNNWGNVTSADKIAIWAELDKMQGCFCAYCQRKLTDAKHIEHFYPRNQFQSQFKSLTFEWNNIFGSCNDSNTCGKHKDSVIGDGCYNPQLLLKPDRDNPEYLINYYGTGTVVVKPSIDENMVARVNETIRVFNLNTAVLEQLRENAVSGYLSVADQINSELVECENDDDLIQLCLDSVQDVLREVENLEFSAVIKSTFKKRLSL